MCSCSPKSKVLLYQSSTYLLEERKCLRDQRLKKGAKGLYQIGLIDKFAARRDQKRSEQHLIFFAQPKRFCEQKAAFDTMDIYC